MKKILAFILCALLICATPIVASAEDGATDSTETSSTENQTVTEKIVGYVQDNIEEISVIVSLVVTMFYEIRKHGKLSGSIGILNKNAITIAENSSDAIKNALTKVEGIAEIVNGYKDEIASLLSEIRSSAEEKKNLKDTLAHVETFLKTAKLATLELSNEVAELLVLANIPNSVKDELYARHSKAVNELKAAEEVMNNDGTET